MGYKRPRSYAIQCAHQNKDYADSTTYYWGNFSALAPSSVEKSTSIPIPINGNIRKVALYFYVGTVGSSEDIEFYIRVNATTDYVISTTVKMDLAATQYVVVLNESLNIPVVAGDTIQIKMVTPA